jgi:hypothetical protein
MRRLPAVAALAAAMLAFVPATSFAQSHAYYSATAANAPEKTNLVTRSTVWKCDGATCTASKANARDGIVCELVAREVGKLTAFSANGSDFDADALTKCNAKAR